MENDKLFCVLGGDLRQYRVARSLSEKGYRVKLFGFDEYTADFDGIIPAASVKEALEDVSYIILPLPYSVDGVNLNAPYMKNAVTMQEIYKEVTPQSRCV